MKVIRRFPGFIVVILALLIVLAYYTSYTINIPSYARPDLENKNKEILLPKSASPELHGKSFEYIEHLSRNANNQLTWFELGPLNRSGRIRAFAPDILNTGTLIAGGVTGGIWKSIDKGESWKLKSNPSEDFGITGLAQDPSNPNTWYACSGEYWSNSPGAGGIYKSTDNGETWTLLKDHESAKFLYLTDRIVVNPKTGSLFVASIQYGIVRSTDGGQHFTSVLGTVTAPELPEYFGKEQFLFSDIAVGANGTLVASTSGGVSTGAGIFSSIDDGQHWKNITPASMNGRIGRSVIAIAPSNNDVCYVYTDLTDNKYGFYKIKLSDGTVEDRSKNMVYLGDIQLPVSQDGYNMTLSVKPDDENFVMIGGASGNPICAKDAFARPHGKHSTFDELSKSNESPSGVHQTHADIHLAVFDPTNSTAAWLLIDGGIYYASDVTVANKGKKVWRQTGHVPNAQLYAVALAPTAGDNRLIAASQDNGHYLLSWAVAENQPLSPFKKYINGGGDGTKVWWMKNHIHTKGDGGFDAAIFKLSDLETEENTYPSENGSSTLWPRLDDLYPDALRFSAGALYNFSAIHPHSDNTILVSSSLFNIARSTKFTSAFNFKGKKEAKTLFETFSTSDLNLFSDYIFTAMEYAPGESDILYFTTSPWYPDTPKKPKLFKWLNASSTPISTAQEIHTKNFPVNGQIMDMAINPANASEFIVLMKGDNIPSLFRSTDGGVTFENIEGNLGGNPVFTGPELKSIAIIPSGKETMYLAGTSTGLFIANSINGNVTEWKREASDKIGVVTVNDIVYRACDKTIAVATFGRSVFIGRPSDLSSGATYNFCANSATTIKSPVGKSEINLVYPNSSQCEFTIFLEDNATLVITDESGRNIRSMTLPQGKQTIELKGEEGVYLINISFKNGKRTSEKIIIQTP